MIRIGVIAQPQSDLDKRWLDDAMRTQLTQIEDPIEGFSSLVAAADRIFAAIVLDRGSTLYAVVPSGHEATLPDDARAEFRRIADRATEVIELDRRGDIGRYIVDSVHTIFAVWDRRDRETSDIVEYASRMKRPLVHLDPVARRVAVELTEPAATR